MLGQGFKTGSVCLFMAFLATGNIRKPPDTEGSRLIFPSGKLEVSLLSENGANY